MTSHLLRESTGFLTGKVAIHWLTEEVEDNLDDSSPLVFDLFEANVLDWENITDSQRLACWDLDQHIRHLRRQSLGSEG